MAKLPTLPAGRRRRPPQGRRHDPRLHRRWRERPALRHVLPPARGRHGRQGRASTLADFATAMEAGIAGIQRLGKAEPGDKTMLDALLPARDALRGGSRPGRRPGRCPRRGRRGSRAGHARHHPARRPQGSGELPRRAQRGSPGPGRDVLASPAQGRCRHLVPGVGIHHTHGSNNPHDQVRRGPRPGHHEHPLHDLRPRRRGRGDRPEGARADLPEARVGRARRDRDLDPLPGSHQGRAGQGRHHRRRPRRRGHHQPARDRRSSGTRQTGKPVFNAIVWQDTRTDILVNEFAKDGGQDRFRAKVGLPLATYFSGPKVRWILDNVPGARAEGRGRRPGVRQHGHLVHLEPHRRRQRRRARHGRHQRQPHHAHEPRDPRLGRRDPGHHGRAEVHAPGDQGLLRGLRHVRRRPRRRAGRGRPGRPAGGPLRPDVLLRPARRRTPTAPAASCS